MNNNIAKIRLIRHIMKDIRLFHKLPQALIPTLRRSLITLSSATNKDIDALADFESKLTTKAMELKTKESQYIREVLSDLSSSLEENELEKLSMVLASSCLENSVLATSEDDYERQYKILQSLPSSTYELRSLFEKLFDDDSVLSPDGKINSDAITQKLKQEIRASSKVLDALRENTSGDMDLTNMKKYHHSYEAASYHYITSLSTLAKILRILKPDLEKNKTIANHKFEVDDTNILNGLRYIDSIVSPEKNATLESLLCKEAAFMGPFTGIELPKYGTSRITRECSHILSEITKLVETQLFLEFCQANNISILNNTENLRDINTYVTSLLSTKEMNPYGKYTNLSGFLQSQDPKSTKKLQSTIQEAAMNLKEGTLAIPPSLISKAISHVLFDILHFESIANRSCDLLDYSLSNTLTTRRGNQLLVALIYQMIAKNFGLELQVSPVFLHGDYDDYNIFDGDKYDSQKIWMNEVDGVLLSYGSSVPFNINQIFSKSGVLDNNYQSREEMIHDYMLNEKYNNLVKLHAYQCKLFNVDSTQYPFMAREKFINNQKAAQETKSAPEDVLTNISFDPFNNDDYFREGYFSGDENGVFPSRTLDSNIGYSSSFQILHNSNFIYPENTKSRASYKKRQFKRLLQSKHDENATSLETLVSIPTLSQATLLHSLLADFSNIPNYTTYQSSKFAQQRSFSSSSPKDARSKRVTGEQFMRKAKKHSKNDSTIIGVNLNPVDKANIDGFTQAVIEDPLKNAVPLKEYLENTPTHQIPKSGPKAYKIESYANGMPELSLDKAMSLNADKTKVYHNHLGPNPLPSQFTRLRARKSKLDDSSKLKQKNQFLRDFSCDENEPNEYIVHTNPITYNYIPPEEQNMATDTSSAQLNSKKWSTKAAILDTDLSRVHGNALADPENPLPRPYTPWLDDAPMQDSRLIQEYASNRTKLNVSEYLKAQKHINITSHRGIFKNIANVNYPYNTKFSISSVLKDLYAPTPKPVTSLAKKATEKTYSSDYNGDKDFFISLRKGTLHQNTSKKTLTTLNAKDLLQTMLYDATMADMGCVAPMRRQNIIDFLSNISSK